MPMSKLSAKVTKRNDSYTRNDISSALDILEVQGRVTGAYYNSDAEYLYKPTGKKTIRCKPENVAKMRAMEKTIDDFLY
ncbi:hypothetical protein HY639_04580 [Candidatus Woesearchaeota archaeon]|nr:hypothetical protein [Candidatus Woesearchaeota archaeon]